MDQVIKLIVLTTGQNLISQIDEVGSADIGQPDCKLTKPFSLTGDRTLDQFLIGVTKDDAFMISSDKIITLAEVAPQILEKYQVLVNNK